MLEPDSTPVARVVALPDADWSPEMLAGLESGIPPGAQFAIASPQQSAPQNPNPVLRQLMLEHSEGGAKTQIAVLLFTKPIEIEVRELESW